MLLTQSNIFGDFGDFGVWFSLLVATPILFSRFAHWLPRNSTNILKTPKESHEITLWIGKDVDRYIILFNRSLFILFFAIIYVSLITILTAFIKDSQGLLICTAFVVVIVIFATFVETLLDLRYTNKRAGKAFGIICVAEAIINILFIYGVLNLEKLNSDTTGYQQLTAVMFVLLIVAFFAIPPFCCFLIAKEKTEYKYIYRGVRNKPQRFCLELESGDTFELGENKMGTERFEYPVITEDGNYRLLLSDGSFREVSSSEIKLMILQGDIL